MSRGTLMLCRLHSESNEQMGNKSRQFRQFDAIWETSQTSAFQGATDAIQGTRSVRKCRQSVGGARRGCWAREGFTALGSFRRKHFLSGAKSGGLVEIITFLQIQSFGGAEGGITGKEKRLRNARAPLALSHVWVGVWWFHAQCLQMLFVLIFFRICLNFIKFPPNIFLPVLLIMCVQTWSRVSLAGEEATPRSGHLTGMKNPNWNAFFCYYLAAYLWGRHYNWCFKCFHSLTKHTHKKNTLGSFPTGHQSILDVSHYRRATWWSLWSA